MRFLSSFWRFTLLALCLTPILRAQDASLKETFQQGKALWATQGDREGASAKLDQVLAALEPKARSLEGEWLQVLCETYNWIAILDDRSPAKRARAAKDLDALLELNPDFEIDRSVTNARLQAIFDASRNGKLGKVKLTVSPDGGVLSIDGKPSPLNASQVKHLKPGAHTITYVKPGYQPMEQRLDLSLKDSKSLELKLPRVSSTVTFNTFPSGAEVLLDGKSVGFTKGQASAVLRPAAEKLGLTVDQLSADFVLADLPAGKHTLEIKALCYHPHPFSIGESFTTPFADHLLEPIKLEPSRGSLTASSAAPGGELFLSGKSYGPLPVKDLQVCSGVHELQVKFPAGGYTQRVEIEEGKSLTLQIRPKPRLVYLGFDGSDDFAGKERFQKMLLGLGERLKEVAFIPPLPNESPLEASDRLKGSKDTELTLLARAVPGKAITQIELVTSTLEGEEEHLVVKPLEADPLENLVTRLNTPVSVSEPWTGLTLLDLPGEPGPWVLQADAAAQKAGVKLGKSITALNGKPVASVQAYRKAIGEFRGEKLTVNQGDANCTLVLSSHPVEIPVNASNLCYPYLLADLRLHYLGAKGDEASLLRLEQALALMHFRKYDKATELLRDARIGTTQGVSQGTFDYYSGVCLLRLGNVYLSEAAQSFNQALKCPQSTLFGPEGPLVSILVKQSLDDLKP